MIFHIWTESGWYLENDKCNISEVLNSQNEILNLRDIIKIKYDYFLILRGK